MSCVGFVVLVGSVVVVLCVDCGLVEVFPAVFPADGTFLLDVLALLVYSSSNVFATSSKAVDDWYQNQLASASLYDKENIHSLYKTLPSHVRTSDTNRLLEKYLSAMGEQFDIIKNYIDNYLNLNKRSYDKYDSVPDNLLEMVANNLGCSLYICYCMC